MATKVRTKVVGYVRVSTEEQADEGVSLMAQEAKLRAYAALYDLDLIKVFIDPGASAKSLERPGLNQALSMLASGEVSGLVITKLDRLTRSVRDWQSLIDLHFSEKAGKQLFSVADSIDTRTAAGRLVLNVLLSVAQWEREVIAERTKEALAHKIRTNERCGKVRFGYDLADDGKTLTPNAIEQRAVTLIRKLRDAGESLRDIAAELNKRGVATKEGRPWIHSSVQGVINRAA